MLDYYFLELQFDFDHVICSKEHLSSCYILSEIRNGIKCQWFYFMLRLFYNFFYTLLGSVNLMINFYYILYPAE